MQSLLFPLRVAAGLAATAVEHARDLPAKLAGLPVTVVSQALQVSMRVQQQVTELAIKGDEVLAGLRPVEETPSWATFDEDLDESRYDASVPSPFDRVVTEISRNGHELDLDDEPDPWQLEQRALAEEVAGNTDEPDGADEPAAAPARAGAHGDAEPDAASHSAVMHAYAEPEPDAASHSAVLHAYAEPTPDPAADPVPAADLAPDPSSDGSGPGPAGVGGYEELSLPQLRARLRRFSANELTELLDYERAHANRPAFVGMLSRRIATVRDHR